MYDYTRFKNIATRLIAKFGGPAVITQKNRTDYDPETGDSTDAPVNTDVTAVFTNQYTQTVFYSVAKTGDKTVLIAADIAIDIQRDDVITVDEVEWIIVNHGLVAPNIVDKILYILLVRQ